MDNFSLCWDCARAVGRCSWAKSLRPVEGWDAKETKPTSNKPYTTYIVRSCPLFERDAYNGGMRREPRKTKK